MHSGQQWIYRGEPQIYEHLLPKAGRVGVAKGAARKFTHDRYHEEAALEMFKRQAARSVQSYADVNRVSD